MLLVVLLVAGCAAIAPRNALPEAVARIDPEGFHNIRYWGDATASEAIRPEPGSALRAGLRSEARRQLQLLAISGGQKMARLARVC